MNINYVCGQLEYNVCTVDQVSAALVDLISAMYKYIGVHVATLRDRKTLITVFGADHILFREEAIFVVSFSRRFGCESEFRVLKNGWGES